uniref:Proline rich Gla (G-carboxyglutamic acid) 2 n=1 Tax=Echeneis naucrates TaxID=173247 RepID=A0A665UFI2_ECHNA
MAMSSSVWISVLSLTLCSAGNPMLLNEQSATSFLSRSLLYNNWDFELLVSDNLERECYEEKCSYEEAREVFEDDTQMVMILLMTWFSRYAPPVDVSGLVAGIVAVLVSAIIATVLGIYIYQAKKKGGVPVRMATDGHLAPEMVPLSAITAPGLPSYSEALNHSGQHDAPPPPYSGGAPSEPAAPEDDE